ncbi:TetR family transcriptional regulator [Mycobacterium sp. CVI_P3]|uniref:TetR family transcriptional regulator n=1 Tax=Mycobacterium pinniadriaticum TaxID=2994102 RepID=A0ABT3SLJ2_9MYCO|nr:TetR family transcriptional regulator [Mycobacterium pinniadriaticum]MCX2933790.1 TetR family transcriptional regulator [Mycobacterium pinniadriaticum]MCX2940212.1 TetR family transcriptional regulator [Mycobacterium pinniadriaticum]
MRTATELRQEILAAARHEFAQHGLAGARIDRVARSAHASKERLYAHFGDKETLFREVVAAGNAEFFRAVTMAPDAIPEFVGAVFDLVQAHPEHHRMIRWALLEGVALDEPQADGEPVLAGHIAAIEAAQASGHVDPMWQPLDLLTLLFGIALGWVNGPHPDAANGDPDVIASRRAAAVEAARRLIAPPR